MTIPATATAAPADRTYLIEQIDDAAVVQVYADGFRDLPLREKTLVWHLYQAAIAGRDIFYDQRYAHNLEMRDVLEAILTHAEGVEAETRIEVARYTKLFWVNTGPYNNLTARKFVFRCTFEAFSAAAHAATRSRRKATMPLRSSWLRHTVCTSTRNCGTRWWLASTAWICPRTRDLSCRSWSRSGMRPATFSMWKFHIHRT